MDTRLQSYGLEPSDLHRRDSRSSELCQRNGLELTWKKKVMWTVKHPVKVNVWGCFSSKGFGRVVCFKESLNAELMCDIYKRALLPTARKQFGHDSMLRKLQEDNDPKHRSKLAVNCKRNNGVHEIYWPSMSPDLAPIENVWQLLKMNLRRKKSEVIDLWFRR